MAIGIVGRKCGMTRVFDESGSSIPVTVIHATPNLITQIKSETVDGYSSVQVTTGAIKTSRVSKALRDTSLRRALMRAEDDGNFVLMERKKVSK